MPTQELILIKKPSYLPSIIRIEIGKDVASLRAAESLESNGMLHLIASPSWAEDARHTKRLAFAREFTPQLGFRHKNVGQIRLNGERVYLFLEQ